MVKKQKKIVLMVEKQNKFLMVEKQKKIHSNKNNKFDSKKKTINITTMQVSFVIQIYLKWKVFLIK